MREIKFRAWDTEREVMATVTHIGLDDYKIVYYAIYQEIQALQEEINMRNI